MKSVIKQFAILLVTALFVSGCSHKIESTVAANKPVSIDPSKPHFTIVADDLATPAEIGTNSGPSGVDATIEIHLRLSTAKGNEFREFTREHIHQQTQLIVGSNVVAEPFIAAEISGGQVELAFSSLDQARAVAVALNKK